jgi:diacylglycerol kinase (ATP)
LTQQAKRQFFILLNPLSGRKKATMLKRLIKALRRQQFDYKVFMTFKDVKSNQHMFDNHLNEYTDLVVLGGDGTLNLAVNHVIGRDIPISFLPCGTGNDFCRSLGITRKNAIDVAINGRATPIDLGKCNQSYFVNAMNVGISKELLKNINDLHNPFLRRFVYVWEALKHIFTFQEQQIHIQGSRQVINKESFIAVFANGNYFGNGMKVAPAAKQNDGLIDCIWLGKHSIAKKLLYLSRIFSGKHVQYDDVVYWQDNEIVIDTPGLDIEMDGDYWGTSPVTISSAPGAIKLRLPK